MLVEEVPKLVNPDSSTIYFSSSINLTARSSANRKAQGQEENKNKGRAKVNYNVNLLMNAQVQVNDQPESGPLKSAQQIQLERITSKRLVELSKESPITTFELPKNFAYNSINSDKNKSRLGNTPTTKRILSSRRNLNLYFEEERNLISINTILGLNYQFLESADLEQRAKKRKTNRRFKPKLHLCCICGKNSSYTRCYSCGLYSCSVRCNTLHNELRCN